MRRRTALQAAAASLSGHRSEPVVARAVCVHPPPEDGFSWVDRRFLPDYAPRLSRDAVLLYFFFASVSDQHGLSFYGDSTIAIRLRLPESAVAAARTELISLDLIAWQRPLIQVLSLPQPKLQCRGGLQSLGDLFRSANARTQS